MRKTLLKHFTENTTEKPVVMLDKEPKSEQLLDLVQEMKPFLQDAATDLLQPRQQLMEQLFKRVLS